MRWFLAGFSIVAGWYLMQRVNTGNQYAEQQEQGGAQAFPLEETPEAEGIDLLGWIMPEQDDLPPLRYFVASEFGDWWPLMSTELLQKLDEFRHRLGVPVMISPADGALGRYLGPTSLSQHNVDMWGEVRAADVMFSGVDLETAYQVAKDVGFTGIGAYPDWNPYPGLHLDVRQAPLALWSGIKEQGKQVYKAISEAFS